MNAFDPYQIAEVSIQALMINLLLAAFCAAILSFVLKRFSRLMVDRSQFTLIFFTLIPLMVLIISVVKSSLALSLGLVGALSIVRFRTPIKEPEELVYLFLAIGVGLGLGAGQVTATLGAFAFIIVSIIAVGMSRAKKTSRGFFLDIESQEPITGEALLSIVSEEFASIGIMSELRRAEVIDKRASATLYIETTSAADATVILSRLNDRLPSARITLIDRSRQLS